LRYKKEGTSIILKPEDFVKVKIASVSSNHRDTIIKAIGYLEGIATEAEVKQYYHDMYNKDDENVEFDEYIKKDIV
jgi:hypothetical protein